MYPLAPVSNVLRIFSVLKTGGHVAATKVHELGAKPLSILPPPHPPPAFSPPYHPVQLKVGVGAGGGDPARAGAIQNVAAATSAVQRLRSVFEKL